MIVDRPSRPLASALSPLAQSVIAAVVSERLFAHGEHVLVAVSGGPDSTALLAVLRELAPRWRLTVSAAHVNFQLRGAESDEDAQFVSALCAEWCVPLQTRIVSMADWRRHGATLQAAARECRYAALQQMAAQCQATTIALGHTADDQAETVVMWLLRGAGVDGMAGMPVRRAPGLVRPLLGVGRADVLRYLTERGFAYRMDSSNATRRYARNRIRHDVMPLLRGVNPRLPLVLSRQAEIVRAEAACLDALAHEALTSVSRDSPEDTVIDVPRFSLLPLAIQRRAIRLLLRRIGGAKQGPSFTMVQRVLGLLSSRPGRTLSCGPVRVSRESDGLVFQATSAAAREFPDGLRLAVPGLVQWGGRTIRAQYVACCATPASTRGATVVLDADRVSAPLSVRSWRPGDRMHLQGMSGRKKLQDLFVDLKVPRRLRDSVPIVVSPQGIVWVAGYRVASQCAADPATTSCLQLDLVGE